MAQLIKFDGTVTEVTPRKGSFQLEELYELLECRMVEAVYLPNRRIMWIDEEGKLRDDAAARINSKASDLLLDAGGAVWDSVIGHALITSYQEVA